MACQPTLFIGHRRHRAIQQFTQQSSSLLPFIIDITNLPHMLQERETRFEPNQAFTCPHAIRFTFSDSSEWDRVEAIS